MLLRYIGWRVLAALVQLVSILVVVFFVMRALPADPVGQLIGLNATEEARRQVEHQLGLDKPVLDQLRDYLGLWPTAGEKGLLHGDLGESWADGSSISAQIGDYLPITLELIFFSFVVACLVAIPVGVLAAFRPRGIIDRATFGYGLLAGSQPEFWWGLLLIYFFYFQWDIAPAPIGRLDPATVPPPERTGALTLDSILATDWHALADAAAHLALPVATLAFVLCGPIMKMVRQNTIEVLESDFMTYATASGLTSGRMVRIAVTNAIAPSLTLVGILLGYSLGGAVLVEQVFSLGGLGQYAVRSVLSLDFPAIQGVVLVVTSLFLIIYLALDIGHAVLDPRVRGMRAES
jgi:ABC-type dipeptide/oligopeptide/nickel transport system permease component